MAGSYFSAILLLMILSALFLGPGMAVHRERKGGGRGGGGGVTTSCAGRYTITYTHYISNTDTCTHRGGSAAHILMTDELHGIFTAASIMHCPLC